ncbi:MAG: hypothetical protein ACOZF2_02335, partial [Thermodesulfobacteriota bacterium]
KPPDKAAFNRARKKIPVEVCQILFGEAAAYAQSLARQHEKLTLLSRYQSPSKIIFFVGANLVFALNGE